MMDRDCIGQTLRPAFWVGLVVALALLAVAGLPAAAGFLAGLAWNVANLCLLPAPAPSLLP